MLGNMLNDLAEAIRRWTEKNSARAIFDDLDNVSSSHFADVSRYFHGIHLKSCLLF